LLLKHLVTCKIVCIVSWLLMLRRAIQGPEIDRDDHARGIISKSQG
jgi:hypothetical protein